MGIITSLKITNFRNINSSKFDFSHKFNVIYGANGSGKTSFLEALYFITHGKSFRVANKDEMVMHNKDRFLISTIVDQDSICAEKIIGKDVKIKKNEKQISPLELIKQFPIHIINHTSFKLLSDGPNERRKFVDWGLFHVEHGFYHVWHNFIHVIQQRNKLLHSADISKINSEITTWNSVLVDLAQKLTTMRTQYLNSCKTYFKELSSKVFPYDFELIYSKGWDDEYNYEEALRRFFRRDCKFGYTTVGPHRAEIEIMCNGVPVQAVLSNGQTKLLIFILKMSQDIYMDHLIGKKCIYLVDDLSAELDLVNQQKLIDLLAQLETQVFISVIDRSLLDNFIDTENRKLFHVEHGCFAEK